MTKYQRKAQTVQRWREEFDHAIWLVVNAFNSNCEGQARKELTKVKSGYSHAYERWLLMG